MFSKILSAAVVAVAASKLAYAQTSTKCDPLSQSCPADPAVGGTVEIDFTQGANDFFTLADGTDLVYDSTMGAVFTINSPSDAPTITSTKYIFFGRVDVTVQAANGVGIVTSSVLQSDDLDEIDWEWLGGDGTQVQTDYFSKGNTTTYTRGGFSGVASPQTEFHTYSIDWTTEQINWEIDGAVVRTLTYASDPSTYPQTPMQLKLGTWDGGAPSEPTGTVQWAGGYTNFQDAPFKGYYKTIKVQDYGNGVTGATSYSYGDHSGTYQSIKINGGSSSGQSSSSSSSSAPSTSTSVAPSTSSSVSSSSTPSTSSVVTSSSSTVSSSVSTTLSTVTTSTTPTPSTGTGSGSSTNSTGSSNTAPAQSSTASSKPTTAPTSSGVRATVNLALLGASVFLGYLAL